MLMWIGATKAHQGEYRDKRSGPSNAKRYKPLDLYPPFKHDDIVF